MVSRNHSYEGDGLMEPSSTHHVVNLEEYINNKKKKYLKSLFPFKKASMVPLFLFWLC